MSDITEQQGMTKKQAQRLELSIIALCLISLVMIFQPFSKFLFSAGAILVVVGGLAFNLVPKCVAGNTFSSVIRTGGIVALVFIVVLLLSIGSAKLYGLYLLSQ
ncbi:MAG: hypothetical protein H8D75_00225 [Rhodospirillaceae bacterium]|nr:hypothetical protein [Rhodospirillaceae bacterium]MBL6931586.1 hypothetical protein [Rhodospirillales bacterium]